MREIHAVGVPVLSSSEDIANTRIVFSNGCVANVTASRISQEKMRKIRVFQADTYVSLDYMNQAGQLCRKTPAACVERPPARHRHLPLHPGESVLTDQLPAKQLLRHVRLEVNGER